MQEGQVYTFDEDEVPRGNGNRLGSMFALVFNTVRRKSAVNSFQVHVR
jgi:hypothetical protein